MVNYREYQTSVMVWLDKSEIDGLLLFVAGKSKEFGKDSSSRLG